MPKFRIKPILIDAVQWNGKNFDEVMNFLQEFHGNKMAYEDAEEYAVKTGKIFITTLHKIEAVSVTDFVIRDMEGEIYPCKEGLFYQIYEPVE